MLKYLATFPAGTYDIIAKSLKGFAPAELKIVTHDDSSVVFESPLTVERLIEIRYFTNVYFVADDLAWASGDKLRAAGDKLRAAGSKLSAPRGILHGQYFSLAGLRGGEPSRLEEGERAALENRIRSELRLEPNTHLARNRFVVIERTARGSGGGSAVRGERLAAGGGANSVGSGGSAARGGSFLGLQLAKAKFKREDLQAGELRPELAHILCLAAGVKGRHAVLDPLAGYGAIPLEAARGFGCHEIVAVDARVLSGRHETSAISWHAGDARRLDFLADGSIDRIVTDPPWGAYDRSIDDLDTLYSDFAHEAARVLKKGGVAVVLSGFVDAKSCLLQFGALEIVNEWPVLISGKKAAIIKLKKR